jgi:hypothetical protein
MIKEAGRHFQTTASMVESRKYVLKIIVGKILAMRGEGVLYLDAQII